MLHCVLVTKGGEGAESSAALAGESRAFGAKVTSFEPLTIWPAYLRSPRRRRGGHDGRSVHDRWRSGLILLIALRRLLHSHVGGLDPLACGSAVATFAVKCG